MIYSDDPNDLGNIRDYEEFIDRLTSIYIEMQPILRPGAYLTIIVKNIKKGGKLYPLAWDLAHRLRETYCSRMKKFGARITSAYPPTGWETPG